MRYLKITNRSKIALLVFLLFYVTFGFVITWKQEEIAYQPWSQDFLSCSELYQASKEIYNGTRMYVSSGDKGMVVLYHGNAGSACNRYYYAELFRQAGFGYILVEYAGYSNDSRSPSHELVKQDVRNTVAFIKDRKLENIMVVGESIGTGAASYHTFLYPPDKLLLMSPFASLTDLAQRIWWYYPTFFMVDNAFDNVSLLQHYAGHATFIHGEKDKIISQKSGLELFNSLMTENKRFFSVMNYGHNDLLNSQQVISMIKQFLSEEISGL